MPDIKVDDNGLFEEEKRLNAYLNSNKLEQLENQHAEIDKRWDFPEVINSIVVVKIPNPTDISLVWVPF
ncbi:hypothetical protein TNCV_3362241 [Trichonephila clavipes]|nr:hypothetical protein TNCV_3362241 [Trichonephila clavipes]